MNRKANNLLNKDCLCRRCFHCLRAKLWVYGRNYINKWHIGYPMRHDTIR